KFGAFTRVLARKAGAFPVLPAGAQEAGNGSRIRQSLPAVTARFGYWAARRQHFGWWIHVLIRSAPRARPARKPLLYNEAMARKVIHVDMDCFYAAVEVKHNPKLKGKPLGVGGRADSRGVL